MKTICQENRCTDLWGIDAIKFQSLQLQNEEEKTTHIHQLVCILLDQCSVYLLVPARGGAPSFCITTASS